MEVDEPELSWGFVAVRFPASPRLEHDDLCLTRAARRDPVHAAGRNRRARRQDESHKPAEHADQHCRSCRRQGQDVRAKGAGSR